MQWKNAYFPNPKTILCIWLEADKGCKHRCNAKQHWNQAGYLTAGYQKRIVLFYYRHISHYECKYQCQYSHTHCLANCTHCCNWSWCDWSVFWRHRSHNDIRIRRREQSKAYTIGYHRYNQKSHWSGAVKRWKQEKWQGWWQKVIHNSTGAILGEKWLFNRVIHNVHRNWPQNLIRKWTILNICSWDKLPKCGCQRTKSAFSLDFLPKILCG